MGANGAHRNPTLLKGEILDARWGCDLANFHRANKPKARRSIMDEVTFLQTVVVIEVVVLVGLWVFIAITVSKIRKKKNTSGK
jgi:hypothetical protein